MPRNMSFFQMVRQIRERTKTVTRRLGWADLRPGERFWAVEKCRGIRSGGKIRRLALLECVANRREPLDAITREDCAREGFPDSSPAEFVLFFCRISRCRPGDPVSRIEFRYMDPADSH